MAEGEENQPAEEQQQSAQPQQPASQWQYNPGSTAAPSTPSASQANVEWTASEFIDHNKGFSWYLALGGFGLVVAALLYLFTRDLVSSVVVCMFAIILGVAGARKPRTLTYRLDAKGLSAGKKFHAYSEFKSFALVEEGAFNSITLLPAKRISLPVSLYVAPDNEQKILEVLGQYLPMQQGGLELTDSLMRRMHF